MTEIPEKKQKNSFFFPSSWRKRGALIYIAAMLVFYLLHIIFLTYEPHIPKTKELLTSHNWVWYYPVLGFVSVMVIFTIAKLIGFGLKRRTNYWEGR